MGGDHKCPVCGSTFTRSQHVARHMRSRKLYHSTFCAKSISNLESDSFLTSGWSPLTDTGDRPYKCVHCGDQFARRSVPFIKRIPHISPTSTLSDLLSRHVNKCHSVDKKTSNQPNNNRRNKLQQQQQQQQPRDPSLVAPSHFSPAQLPQPPQTGRPLYAQDPFASVYQQSPRRYSSDAPDPPSLSSSSVTSMSSASLDSLPTSAPPNEPVFHVPQQQQQQLHHYQPHPSRQWTGPSGNNMSPFSYMPPNDNGMMFKQEPYQPSLNGMQHYNDLPTPMAYPGAPFRLDPFIPNQSQIHVMDNGMYMQSPQQSQPNGRPVPSGRGGEFSSAFGLMSLDDAAVLAGLSSDGAPFFENQSSDGFLSHQPNGQQQQQQQQPSNGTFSSGIMGLTNPDPNPAQTPNTKEREMRTVREMWAAFLRDPTTGLKPDGTEMGKPEYPTPPSFQQQQQPQPHQQLHRRSSSYSGGVSSLSKAMAQSGGGPYSHASAYSHQTTSTGPKSPHMPTAQHTLHGGTVVVKKLEDQASKIDHDGTIMAGTPAPAGTGLASATSPDSLRSYEEAILSRKAPVLKLPAKMKTRDSSGSANSTGGSTATTSGILPSISQSSRANAVGGGVASLSIQQQQQLPTAAGASGVPPGSTPNTAFYTQTSMVDRPVIAMPKSRSRPTTANGSSSRPGTASGGNSAHGSQPSSRPGTASSTSAGGGNPVYSPRHSGHPSPHIQAHAHSLPGSRPSTSSAPSPSHSFAFTLPPPPFQNHQSSSSFQPGSLPSDSLISPASATSQHQLVSALANAGMLDNSSSNRGRPTYKRLASQVLEPALTKRPHIRRGDTNFNPTYEDQGNDSAMDGFDSEGLSDAGGSERAFGYDHRGGYGGGGAGFGYEPDHGMNAFSARRMSEPAVAAPRMMMRMPGRGGN